MVRAYNKCPSPNQVNEGKAASSLPLGAAGGLTAIKEMSELIAHTAFF